MVGLIVLMEEVNRVWSLWNVWIDSQAQVRVLYKFITHNRSRERRVVVWGWVLAIWVWEQVIGGCRGGLVVCMLLFLLLSRGGLPILECRDCLLCFLVVRMGVRILWTRPSMVAFLYLWSLCLLYNKHSLLVLFLLYLLFINATH